MKANRRTRTKKMKRKVGNCNIYTTPSTLASQYMKLTHSLSHQDFLRLESESKTHCLSLVACENRLTKRKLTHSRSHQDFPCLESESKTHYPSLVACENRLTKRSYSFVENIGRWFLNDDIVIEILSRLPIELVLVMKCVCKRWCHLTTSHLFRNAHFRNSRSAMSGIFIQGMHLCVCCEDIHDNTFVNYLAIGQEGKNIVKQNILDFLPEKVVVAASCNGLLICRSLFRRIKDHTRHHIVTKNPLDGELVIYVCNPLTKEFNALKPNLTNKERCGIGLAFNALDPFYTCFEVVVVQVLRKAKFSFCYVFKIYSSKTDTWRVSKEVCHYSHRLVFQRHFFVNGKFYWLTGGHSILTFDLKEEKSHIIKLPNPVIMLNGRFGMCLGESEGYIHYVSSTRNEFRVWILNRDYSEPEWELKYFRHVSCAKLVNAENWNGRLVHPYNLPHSDLVPFAFKDDIVFMEWSDTLCRYDIKTGNIDHLSSFRYFDNSARREPIILPYRRSLLPVCNI